MKIQKSLIAVVAGTLFSLTVQAQTYNVSLNYGASPYASPVLIPGNTLDYNGYNDWSFTVTSSTIAADNYNITGNYGAGSFNGLVFVQQSGDPISDVTLNPASTFPGLVAGDVTFTASEIKVNLEGLTATPGSTVLLDITSNSVPEPTTVALAGLGSLALLAFRRKQA